MGASIDLVGAAFGTRRLYRVVAVTPETVLGDRAAALAVTARRVVGRVRFGAVVHQATMIDLAKIETSPPLP